MRTLKGWGGPVRQSEHLQAPKDGGGGVQRPARCEQGMARAAWEAASNVKKVCGGWFLF